jgi:hypothetical protein
MEQRLLVGARLEFFLSGLQLPPDSLNNQQDKILQDECRFLD